MAIQDDVDSLTRQVGILTATVNSLQAQVQTFQADLQMATLTMESSFNDLSQSVCKLYTVVNQLIAAGATAPSS